MHLESINPSQSCMGSQKWEEVLSFLLPKGQWLAVLFVKSNSTPLLGELHVKGLQMPVLLQSHHQQDQPLLGWAHTLWSTAAPSHHIHHILEVSISHGSPAPHSVHPHLSQQLEHKDGTPPTSAVGTKIKKCEYPVQFSSLWWSSGDVSLTWRGQVAHGEISCLAVNDLGSFHLWGNHQGEGAALVRGFQSCSWIPTPAIIPAVCRSAGTGWAWRQNELPAGQGCLGVTAPGSAAGARPALDVPPGKPGAQLVGSPRVGVDCVLQGWKDVCWHRGGSVHIFPPS